MGTAVISGALRFRVLHHEHIISTSMVTNRSSAANTGCFTPKADRRKVENTEMIII